MASYPFQDHLLRPLGQPSYLRKHCPGTGSGGGPFSCGRHVCRADTRILPLSTGVYDQCCQVPTVSVCRNAIRCALSRHMQTTNSPQWLTVEEACDHARCSRAGLYKWWAQGVGPRYVKRGRNRLTRTDWLDDWMMSQEVAA